MSGFIKKNWFGLLSASASFIILAFYVVFIGGIRNLFQIARSIQLYWLVLAGLCIFIYWLLDGIVLLSITRLKYKSQRILPTMKTVMIGFLYSALTPFATGGQPMQILEMTQNGINAGDAGSFITVKSIIYQFSMTIYALFAVALNFHVFRAGIPDFIIFVTTGFILNAFFIIIVIMIFVNRKITSTAAIAVVNLLDKVRLLKNRKAVTENVMAQIDIFHKSSLLINREKGVLLSSIIVTVIQLTVFYIIPYCIYRSLGLSGTAAIYLVAAVAVITMITAFIPLPGASGAAEGSFYLFYALYFTKLTVAPAVFLWRCITYYSCILVGGAVSLIDLLRKNRNRKT